jgi:hypothetical protein
MLLWSHSKLSFLHNFSIYVNIDLSPKQIPSDEWSLLKVLQRLAFILICHFIMFTMFSDHQKKLNDASGGSAASTMDAKSVLSASDFSRAFEPPRTSTSAGGHYQPILLH